MCVSVIFIRFRDNGRHHRGMGSQKDPVGNAVCGCGVKVDNGYRITPDANSVHYDLSRHDRMYMNP